MKAADLRKKDSGELIKELIELRKNHFSLRMQVSTQQLTDNSKIKKVKKDIARVKTIIREKTKEGTV